MFIFSYQSPWLQRHGAVLVLFGRRVIEASLRNSTGYCIGFQIVCCSHCLGNPMRSRGISWYSSRRLVRRSCHLVWGANFHKKYLKIDSTENTRFF